MICLFPSSVFLRRKRFLLLRIRLANVCLAIPFVLHVSTKKNERKMKPIDLMQYETHVRVERNFYDLANSNNIFTWFFCSCNKFKKVIRNAHDINAVVIIMSPLLTIIKILHGIRCACAHCDVRLVYIEWNESIMNSLGIHQFRVSLSINETCKIPSLDQLGPRTRACPEFTWLKQPKFSAVA